MEMQLVETFSADPSLKELSGFTTLNGQEVFYNSRPMRIGSENCLTCHSDPKNAPASLINTYGSEHGFGWKMGEVIAAQTLYVPASDVFAEAQNAMRVVMGIIIALFALVVLVTNMLLRRAVVRPVVQIAHLAQLIQADTLTPASPELGDGQQYRRADRRTRRDGAGAQADGGRNLRPRAKAQAADSIAANSDRHGEAGTAGRGDHGKRLFPPFAGSGSSRSGRAAKRRPHRPTTPHRHRRMKRR